MGTITKVLSGTAVLIGLYLVLRNYTGATKIINATGGVYADAVKVLQGR